MYKIKGRGNKLKIFLLILSLILVGSIFVSSYVIEDSKVFTNIKEIAKKIADATTTGASYSITVSGTTTNYDTLAEAVEAATNGNTIVVLKDVTDTSTVNVNKDITLDTNGHTINRKSFIAVTPEGTLVIKGNGKITMVNDCVILNNGKVTLKEATLKSTSDASSGIARGIYNNGKLIIESGTIEAEGYEVAGIVNSENVEATISGGNIKVSSEKNEANGIFNSGKVTITSGTIEVEGYRVTGILNQTTADLTITGGNITASHNNLENAYAYGIKNNSINLIIGDETKELTKESPVIYGETVAATSKGKEFNFYNGTLSSASENIYTGTINLRKETALCRENTNNTYKISLEKGIACDITSDENKLTNKEEITYIITFADVVTGFEESDITVTNGTIKSFSGSGDTYNLVVTNEGTCAQTISIAKGVCQNANSLTNGEAKYIMQIDREAPTIEEITPNGNSTWTNKQNITVKFKDDVAVDDKITATYIWYNDGKMHTSGSVENGGTITLGDVTGKYLLLLEIKDEVGNVSAPIITKEYSMDGSVTKPGKIKAMFEDQTKEYEFAEIKQQDKYMNGYQETIDGIYTTQNIYISIEDTGKDDESGIKSVTYQLYTIDENGETLKTLISEPTKTKILLEKPAKYKLVLTTTDNCGNSVKINYIINKEKPEVKLTPEKTNGYVKKQEIEVNVENISKETTIYYSWADEKTKEENITNWTQIENGAKITAEGLSGEYNLEFKIVYPTGEVEYVRKGTYYFDNTVDKVASLIAKIDNASGEDYKDYTNKNVYINLANDAKDVNIIVKSNYEILDEVGNVVASGSEIGTVIEAEGYYVVKVTSEDGLGNKKTEEHIIKIDRTSPEVKFDGSTNYIKDGAISVEILDAGKNASGLKEDMRYYWTRSTKTPKKSNFYGSDEEGYTGKINSAKQSISIPDGISGVWYLWIYAEDKCGNVAIKSNIKIENDGNISYIDNEAPIAGKIKATTEKGVYNFEKENDKYLGEFTNKDVTIILRNGYDADSGVKSNKYTIKKSGTQIYTGTEEYTIKESGIYQIIVETVDNKSNKSQREYEVKIDKVGANIKLDKKENKEYAKMHTVSVEIKDELSGLKNKNYYWIGCNSNVITEEIADIEEIIKEKDIEKIKELVEQKQLEMIKVEEADGKINTPSGKTGHYYLYIVTEDNCGNTKDGMYGPYYIDNTNPTKPYVEGTISELIGTTNKDVIYYGETTNKKVTVNSYDSYSLSGVDKYEVKYTTDLGKTWTEWKACTKEINKEIIGSFEVNNHGKTILKFRGISVLKDGVNYGEESEEYVVIQDKKGPKITFDVKSKTNERIILTISATDENKINENSLKYAWYKKENNKEITEEEISKLTFTTFINGADIITPEGAEGTYVLIVKAEDIYGNQTIAKSEEYKLIQDKKGPEITFDVKSRTNERIILTINATDENKINENSLKYAWYKKEGNKEITEEEIEKLTFTSFVNGAEITSPEGLEGTYVLIVKAEDVYGNKTIGKSEEYKLTQDKTAPKITYDVNEKLERTERVTITVSVTDDIAVNENSLKYAWYKKEENKEITEDEIEKLTFTSFINGAEITSPEGLEGKYILVTKAEDISGNKTIGKSDIYYIGTKTINYKIENRKIYNVSPETTKDKFIENIKNEILGSDYKVYTKEGTEETSIVKTGEILKVDGREYTIIVNGDINADGLVTLTDLSAIKKTIVGKKELNAEAIMAGDINGDGIITVIDLSKIKKALVGKIML